MRHKLLTTCNQLVPPSFATLLLQVGSLLGALVYKGTLVPELASDMVYAAAGASCGPGGSSTSQRLANNMWSAVGKQTGACRRAEEQMQEAKQKEERQLAELHQPRVYSPYLLYHKMSAHVRKSHAWVFHFPGQLFCG